MGLIELLSTVLAFSAPISVVSGYIPIILIYGGIGAPAIYLAATVVLLIFAVGFTAMSRHVHTSGAFYAYVTAGLGPIAGLGAAMLAIFAYLLLGFCTLPFFGVNLSALVADVFHGQLIDWYWYGLVCCAAIGVLSYFEIGLSAKVLTVAMVLEVLVILVFDVAVGRDGGPQGPSWAPFYWSSFMSGSLGISVLFAATCFFGFEATAVFRDEVRDPDRTVPRAAYLSIILIGMFYASAAWILIMAYGVDSAVGVASQDIAGMFPAALERFVGATSVDIMRVLLATSLFAGGLSGQNIVARYLFNLGVDGALPRVLSRVHHRHHSPYVASMVVSAAWLLAGLFFVVLGTDPVKLYARAAGVGGFSVLVLMLFTSAAVVVFFRTRSSHHTASIWHRTVAPSTATIALAVVVYLAVTNFGLLIDGSSNDAIILQVVTWGMLLFGMGLAEFYRRRRPDLYLNIGRGRSGELPK
ncbi:MAG: APC family permease [Dehalococcoidia bacterium]